VIHCDERDAAVPHISFGLESRVSTATKTSAHDFTPRVSFDVGPPPPPTAVSEEEGILAADLALQIWNRHQAAADLVAAAQVNIGRLLDARSTPATIAVPQRERTCACVRAYGPPNPECCCCRRRRRCLVQPIPTSQLGIVKTHDVRIRRQHLGLFCECLHSSSSSPGPCDRDVGIESATFPHSTVQALHRPLLPAPPTPTSLAAACLCAKTLQSIIRHTPEISPPPAPRAPIPRPRSTLVGVAEREEVEG